MIIPLLLAALLALAWLGVTVIAWVSRVARVPSAVDERIAHSEGPAARIARQIFGAGLAEIPLVIGLALLLTVGTLGFFGVLEDVVMGDPIVALDRRIYDWLQALRTPLFDRLLIAVTGLGDQDVVIPVAIAALATCALFRRWRAAAFLAASVAGAAVFIGGVKRVIHRPRPVSIYDGVAEYSFPSGHAAMSIVLYGFIAVLILQSLRKRGGAEGWRRPIAFAYLALVLIISFSRIYLGAHWFSDVAAGLLFGVAWVALLTMLYLRRERDPVPAATFALVTSAAVIAAGVVHIARDTNRESNRYAVPSSASAPAVATPAVRQP